MPDRRSLPPHEDSLSLALLRSADQDEPPSAAYGKVATALGVGAAFSLGALPAPAALASGGLSAAALRWSSSLFAKVGLTSVSAALLVSGGVALLGHRSTQATLGVSARHASRSRSALLASPPASDPPRGLAERPFGVPGALAPASSATVHRKSLVRGAPALVALHPRAPSGHGAARESSLPEQVLSLDRARVLLNSGDPGSALAEIAHYRAAWPRGVFLTEASVLEIEALAKRGETALAAARAQSFVASHPDSPQADRLRALIPAARE